MPTLRTRLKSPKPWLFATLLVYAAAFFDVTRAPEAQWLSRAYVGAVRIYQSYGRPMLEGHIACRYSPSCSVYSVEAVERHGLPHGLWLTVRRIASCQSTVAPGTRDPVP